MSLLTGSPTTHPHHTRRLSRRECHDWLTSHGEGRLGYTSGRGPRSVVVSYSMADEQIVVRLPDYNEVVQYAPGSAVTFEVEGQTDTVPAHETVSVSGTAELAGPGQAFLDVAFAESWPDGVATSLVCLPLTAVEGFELAHP